MPDSVFIEQGATIMPAVLNEPLEMLAARSWSLCTTSASAATSLTLRPVSRPIVSLPLLLRIRCVSTFETRLSASNGKVNVLYNRCPHRGNMICGDTKGNTGEFFRCSYHAWTFHHDGKLKNIPMKDAYAGTRYGKDNPDCSIKKAARVENYRGFV